MFSIARIAAALKMKVEDLRPRRGGSTIRLHEKSGKEHVMPCHHALAEALHVYIEAAGIGEDRTLMFNYHDLGHLGADRAAMNRAVFRALKPGGFYIIADHAGRPGTGISESGTLHRIEEDFLRQEVEAAGFMLVEEGKFLRNPNDPRDKNTPDPPQPKDEFVLKFVRP
jgi:predicted methyltransferase